MRFLKPQFWKTGSGNRQTTSTKGTEKEPDWIGQAVQHLTGFNEIGRKPQHPVQLQTMLEFVKARFARIYVSQFKQDTGNIGCPRSQQQHNKQTDRARGPPWRDGAPAHRKGDLFG